MSAPFEHRALEAREQRFDLEPPPRQQRMDVAALRHSRAFDRALGERVAIDHRDPLEEIGQDARGAHAGHASANHNRMRVCHLDFQPFRLCGFPLMTSGYPAGIEQRQGGVARSRAQ